MKIPATRGKVSAGTDNLLRKLRDIRFAKHNTLLL